MYRWPQGRVIRVICLLLLGLVVADLAWYGRGRLVAYLDPSTGSAQHLVQLIIFFALSLGLLIGGVVAIGFHHTSAQFLIEVEQEMLKVTWPVRGDVVRLTIMIAVMAVILAGVIFGVDSVLLAVRGMVLDLEGVG